MLNKYKLGIVIPCYNEGKRAKLQLFREYIHYSKDYLFCFINDGSTDKTLDILTSFNAQFPDKVIIYSNAANLGKAEAVRVGFNLLLTYKISYIGFMDADLSTPLSEMGRLFGMMSNQKELCMVFGSRAISPDSCINRTRFRRWAAGIFSVLARQALRMNIHDTQCGLKIFNADLASLVFKDPFHTRWLFDVEIFARAKTIYGSSLLSKMVKEVPLHKWDEMNGSKMLIHDYIKIPFQLLYLTLHINSSLFKRRFQGICITMP